MDVIVRFTAAAARAGATVETVATAGDARDAVARLASRLGSGVVTASGPAAALAPPGAVIGGAPEEVADALLGVSIARIGVAETGSVLLGSNATTDRLPGMLAHTHAVILPARRLVATLDDAAPILRDLAAPGDRQIRSMSFVTGPSRSADIERVITVGVQGPRALHVVIVEGDVP